MAVGEVTCPKCHSGIAALYRRDRWLADGSHLEEIACRLCSDVLASRLAVRQARVVRREEAATVAQGTARAALSEIMTSIRRRQPEEYMRPCPVPGCDGSYYEPCSRRKLCAAHASVLRSYEHRLQMYLSGKRPNRPLLPSILRVNGSWVRRGDPLPGLSAVESRQAQA